MNIEDIKAELAQIEPEADAAWTEYKRLEQLSKPAQDRWHAIYTRVNALRSALEVLEPKGEHNASA